jgi:hypothetical protein
MGEFIKTACPSNDFFRFQNKNPPYNGVQSVQKIVTTFTAYRSYLCN